MPTIEACFNCVGTRSSDTKKIKIRQQNSQNSKIYAYHLYTLYPPPPSGGEGGLSKMAQVPKGEKFSTATSTLGVKTLLSISRLYLKQL